jgi:hypothetical protein
VPTSLPPCCKLGKGVGVTVKLVALVAEPPTVLTETAPVTAPGITRPTTTVPVLEITIAVLPPIVKAVGLFKPVPLIVTRVPAGPPDGVKVVIVGCAQARLWHKTQKKSRNFLFILCFFTVPKQKLSHPFRTKVNHPRRIRFSFFRLWQVGDVPTIKAL